jgi:L-cysteine/cystine lyase
VAWNTGVRLPLAEIVAMAHSHHVLCAVDAAQSAGAIALDLPASGVDFYAMPGQKWLCGPEGTGALYVRPDRLSLVAPVFVGFRTMGEDGGFNYAGDFMPASTARRYETGTTYRPGIQAMAANMVWQEETVGRDWIYSRIIELAAYARNALAQVSGIEVITPPGPHAGLVTFTLDGYEPPRVNAKLAEDNIVIRYLNSPPAVRVSTHFYNIEEDIDRLVTALEAILASDPESLPKYP